MLNLTTEVTSGRYLQHGLTMAHTDIQRPARTHRHRQRDWAAVVS